MITNVKNNHLRKDGDGLKINAEGPQQLDWIGRVTVHYDGVGNRYIKTF
jgi:hypothetical protein